MDRAAILHRPLSEYAHALDDTTYIFRLRAACGDVQHCLFCYADRAEQRDTLTFFSAPMTCVRSDAVYDTLDYFRVDPTRGTAQDLRELVSAAHVQGIRVMLDGVFNHVCWRHPFFRDVLEKGSASAYYDWFYGLPEVPRYPGPGGHPEYICFSYVPEMPKTNTAHPEVMDYFCRVGEYWLRECDADGWRLDVANEVDDSFLQVFRRRIKAVKSDALVIGEVWENAAHYLENNLLDSAMNYDFRRFCRQFFAEQSISAEEFDVRVSELLMRYPRQAIPAQLNLLDSHDVSRFLTLCGGDRDKMELAVVFQMTFPGMPCVFYGDEKGLQGRTEPEYRQAMDFSREDSMEQVYRRLIALRNSTPALRHGRFTTVLAKGTVYVYQRQTQSERVTVYLNTGPDAISVPSGAVLSKRESNGLMSGGGYSILIETIGD